METAPVRKRSVVSNLGPNTGKSLIQKGLIRSETTVYFITWRTSPEGCFLRRKRVLAAENKGVSRDGATRIQNIEERPQIE
jgi:hypothetical protein